MVMRSGRVLGLSVVVIGLTVAPAGRALAAEELLPPNAKPGECYARVFIPPKYKTETKQVLKREASERIEVIPAKYELVEQQVPTKEASEVIEAIPPEYGWVEEQVLVRPASFKLEEIEPEYEWVEEKVLDKAAHTVWKKGEGPIQQVDHSTGEIMCLVEVPATYKTIKKRVLKKPATTRKIEVPAEYTTVKKRVVKKPAGTKTVSVPAEFTTLKVMKLVSEAQERRIPIPAEHQDVTKTEKISEGHMEWQQILCQTNLTKDVITQIQQALQNAGLDPGPIDGSLGFQTLQAVRTFQETKGLATGGLTLETLAALGVSRPHPAGSQG